MEGTTTYLRNGVTEMRHSICVGIDGSIESTDAARVAASLARDLDRRLVLVHVADDPPFPYGDRARREVQRRALIQQGGNLLDAVATEIGEPEAERRVALSRFILGGVQERLIMVSREEEADLLVIGARLRHGSAHAPFRGATWSRFSSLAGSSRSPVLVVPRGAGPRFAEGRHAPQASILCGVDGSAGSERARRVASDLAEGLGLRLLPVSVERAHSPVESQGVLQVVGRDPAALLAEVASSRRASLIAVGMDSGEVRRDSVARELAVTAPVPVLIVARDARMPTFAPARIADGAIAA
jgi:nucleotide-binding universal stress UspA family protein